MNVVVVMGELSASERAPHIGRMALCGVVRPLLRGPSALTPERGKAAAPGGGRGGLVLARLARGCRGGE